MLENNDKSDNLPTAVHAMTGTKVALGATQIHPAGCAGRCCGDFKSPFNIDTAKIEKLPEDISISVHFDPTPLAPKYKRDPRGDHLSTIELEGTPGSTFTISNGETHFQGRLVNFHVHFAGEHAIDGKRHDGELHFVFKDEHGKLAVLGVMIEENGKPNPLFDDILAHLDSGKTEGVLEKVASLLKSILSLFTGSKETGKVPDPHVNFNHLLPRRPEIFYTTGQTTVPDAQGGFVDDVQWVLLKEPITMSREQIQSFQQAIGGRNNRPLQPATDRPVFSGNISNVTQRMPVAAEGAISR